jgi:hypothetical protein
MVFALRGGTVLYGQQPIHRPRRCRCTDWPGGTGKTQLRDDLGGALLTAGQPFEAIGALEAVLAAAPGAEPADLSLLDIQDTLSAADQAAGRNPDAVRLAAHPGRAGEAAGPGPPGHPGRPRPAGGFARSPLAQLD